MNEVHKQGTQTKSWKLLNTILRDLFYITEYTLRYFFKIMPSKITFKNILYDRYVYDLLLLKEKTRLLEWFVHIYPKPKQTIVLYGNCETIWQRKKELTVKELDRQQNIMLGLKSKRITPIENITIDETIKTIFKVFYKNTS